MIDPADPALQAVVSEQDQRSRFIHARLPYVFGLLCALTGNPEEAQELAQEAMIKVLQRHSGPRDLDNAAERLRDVSISLAMDFLHRNLETTKKPARARALSVLYVPSIGPTLLDALSVPERVAFMLRDVEGLPVKQVARYMGCSVKEARVFLAKARITLQELSTPESRA